MDTDDNWSYEHIADELQDIADKLPDITDAVIDNKDEIDNPDSLSEQKEIEPVATQLLLDYDMAEIEKLLAEIDALEAQAIQARNKKPLRSQTQHGRAKTSANGASRRIKIAIYGGDPAEAKAQQRSFAIGLMVFSLCMFIAIGGVIYDLRGHPALRLPIGTLSDYEQRLQVSNTKLIELVRNSPSKLPGSTIGQALTNYLNGKHGPGWQPVGWKVETGQGAVSTVKFLWIGRGVGEEACWQVDTSTRKVKAANQEAARVGP